MGLHEWAEFAGIVAVAIAVVAAIIASVRFFWRSGALVFALQSDVNTMKQVMETCQVHLTNHLPHQISDLQLQVQAIKERLELHEAREEKHWELLTAVMTKRHSELLDEQN